jgi:predicted nucleic acid-binding protein
MTALVVDVSVGVKWVIPEVHTAAALRLLGPGYELHSPSFIAVESANVFWKKLWKGELARAEVDARLAAFGRTSLVFHPDRDLVPAAFDIAAETGRTVYDSLYLALAHKLGVRLATADEKFRNGLANTRWASHILWVADIP